MIYILFIWGGGGGCDKWCIIFIRVENGENFFLFWFILFVFKKRRKIYYLKYKVNFIIYRKYVRYLICLNLFFLLVYKIYLF